MLRLYNPNPTNPITNNIIENVCDRPARRIARRDYSVIQVGGHQTLPYRRARFYLAIALS